MTFGFIRILFILLSTTLGFQLGSELNQYGAAWGLIGACAGAALALVVILLESGLGRVSLRGLSAAVFGLILALIVSHFVSGAVDLIPDLEPGTASVIKLIVVLVLGYLGMVLSMRGRDEFNIIVPYVKFERRDQKDDIVILDTSAIVDGRILDICQTKFLEGNIVVPRFVLKELHQIADSQDPLRRARGRRGLDVLNKLRKSPQTVVRIHEEDFPATTGVDDKIVKLAKLLGGRVLTTDFNLNKIAELQGVSILNVNDLANALRPVVLPGEAFEVRLVKEGKEYNQAVGYLEDGTMVVVDNGRRFLGSTLKVNVTSVLQTAAGRMIFARLDGDRPEARA